VTRALRWWRSLSVRLAVTIGLLLIVLILVLNMVLLLTVDTPDGIVSACTFAIMERALGRDAQGHTILIATPELRAAMARNTTIRLGVIDPATKLALPGSDEQMARIARVVADSGLQVDNFDAEPRTTAFGDLLMVSYAEQWTWTDVARGFRRVLLDTLKVVTPIGLVLALPIAGVIWWTLRPMRRAGRLAESLSLRALDGRVPTRHMPSEILPFVHSINGVLDRLDQDVHRQRRFITNAAHELRTPLSVLRARLDTVPPSRLKDELTADADRLAELIQQMLTIARLGDLALPLDQEIDIVATVRDIVADFAPIAIDRGRTLGFSATEPRAIIRGNRQAFASAVINVIENALRAEPEGGSVDVVVGPGARVSIADHGPGIDGDDLTRLFEPFWRKDHGSPGSGLGLPIVQESMRLHHGQVRVRSQPGHGATFELDFAPAEEGASARG
jgi:signal transduction histidine kinase